MHVLSSAHDMVSGISLQHSHDGPAHRGHLLEGFESDNMQGGRVRSRGLPHTLNTGPYTFTSVVHIEEMSLSKPLPPILQCRSCRDGLLSSSGENQWRCHDSEQPSPPFCLLSCLNEYIRIRIRPSVSPGFKDDLTLKLASGRRVLQGGGLCLS